MTIKCLIFRPIIISNKQDYSVCVYERARAKIVFSEILSFLNNLFSVLYSFVVYYFRHVVNHCGYTLSDAQLLVKVFG